MSAPSAEHERRVATLAAIASASGHTRRLSRLPDGSVPDVLHVAVWAPRLFLADAKQSEGPGEPAATARLHRYLRICGQVADRGYGVTVAIGCPSVVEARGWLAHLRRFGGPQARDGVAWIDSATAVAHRTVPAATT